MIRIQNIGIFSFLMLAGLITGLLAFFDSGLKGIVLLSLGVVLGITFLFFQYGFASGWRNLIIDKNPSMISYHFLLAAICSLFFIPLIGLKLRYYRERCTCKLIIGTWCAYVWFWHAARQWLWFWSIVYIWCWLRKNGCCINLFLLSGQF